MILSRRSLLAATATAAVVPARLRAQTRPVVRIGVINDMSGPYRDLNGPTAVICTKQAVLEFAAGGFDVEVLSADHQNKPDVAVSIARQWIDQQRLRHRDGLRGVLRALALASLCKEKNKVMIATSTATSDLTGKACTPNSIHWVFDTYMEAKSTGGAMVKAGGDSWYHHVPTTRSARPCSATRHGSSRRRAAKYWARRPIRSPKPPISRAVDQGAVVRREGPGVLRRGRRSGERRQTGGGIRPRQVDERRRDGGLYAGRPLDRMEGAQGMRLSESYYWDLNDRTRSFQKRIQPKVQLWPSMAQAGNYSCTLHYLKAVQAWARRRRRPMARRPWRK